MSWAEQAWRQACYALLRACFGERPTSEIQELAKQVRELDRQRRAAERRAA